MISSATNTSNLYWNQEMPIFTLDGNIGAGKSTILAYIHDKYDVAIDVEPIDIWQPFLNDLYAGKPCAAFNMQIRVWLDRCMINPGNKYDVIMERSPFFQRGVFVATNAEDGNISPIQNEMIQHMYDKTDEMWSPKCFIYLRSDPDKCIQRIATRGRPSEDAILDTYLHKLHELHETCYVKAVAERKNIVCIEVEGKTVAQIGEEVWRAIQAMKCANRST
jgi:deoxyadenosine/deoxycytidine kinase